MSTLGKLKKYDKEFKVQAVKLGKEIGQSKAASELGISSNTLYTWTKKAKEGMLDFVHGTQTPQSAMSLSEEIIALKKKLREQEKEIKLLKKTNEFLEEASAFFAASRQKSAKTVE